MTGRDKATERQVQAAMPTASTWLAANAGSGKTRVLTDRVARLLLHEVPPEKILCLTYTKAAASEMQNRLFKRLGGWAMMPDEDLAADLAKLGEGRTLTPDLLSRARRLFASAIETPGGLKIQTIHSFCAALLRRFPLEAGVSPQFSEMEDRAGALMRAEIVEDMADGPNAWRLHGLARHLTDQDFSSITAQIAAHRIAFDPPRGRDDLMPLFDLPAEFTLDDLRDAVFDGSEADLLRALCAVLPGGTKRDAGLAEKLAPITAPDLADLPILENVFLTGSSAKEPFSAKIGTVPGKALQTAHPELVAQLDPFMQRIEQARPMRLALASVDKAVALHDFAAGFLPEYARRKELAGALDFDDLIHKARALLSDPSVAEWVLFRLDGGIDHILVDEAQDTSPAQWDVVDRLAREFTAGEGARANTKRTIFVVGDKKQSIYSFQGADPDGFDRMQREFDARLTAVGGKLQDLVLEHSFRSSSAILQVVDQVFEGRDGAGFQDDGRHVAFKSDLPGRVDLWPLVDPVEKEPDPHWTDPVDRLGETHHSVVLAQRIAAQITQMIAQDTLPDGAGQRRKVTAGDIMILVQGRSDLFAEIIRACKTAKLPIAGADRLKVGAELAVRDLAALLRFLDTPEDDLSLACALKSPLFEWSEQDLFTLAHGRGKSFLWETLRQNADSYRQVMQVVTDLRDNADFLRPYDLIDRILTRHRGREKLLARLGPEAEDGINALLSQALSYERSEIPSLTGFLAWMDADTLEIKRQIGSGDGLIRVMTVHGSKGLESPIVILPDTALKRPPPEQSVIDLGGAPLWRAAAADSPPALAAAQAEAKRKREEERQRLLYVAMTRAERWLIVAAAGKLDPKNGDSWYQQIETAMTTLGAPHRPMPGGEGLRLEHGNWADGTLKDSVPEPPDKPDLPALFSRPPPEPSRPPTILSPSDLGGAKALPGPDGLDEDAAKARGTAVHLLLETLPDQDPEHWPDAAAEMLPDISPDSRDMILAEATRVLQTPELAALFSTDSLAEVDITAQLGSQIMAGQIDRLILSQGRVLIVDFKTNATVPARAEDAPEGLLRQMGAYQQAVGQIYPDRQVDCAILWTRSAQLMSLPHDLVNAALARALQLDALSDDT
ncbi:MAG: double-strand break repair helicase AddA [Rhodobacteraceae bacterium]|nr:double-strand break repair helicase AddA [Paracoccaceae bacterium]